METVREDYMNHTYMWKFKKWKLHIVVARADFRILLEKAASFSSYSRIPDSHNAAAASAEKTVIPSCSH